MHRLVATHFVLRITASQVSVECLLPKIDGMLPEGVGKRRAFVKTGPAARLTNELLENAKFAVEKLWKQRGYDPKKPELTKARLGYACDQYEAFAYLVTGALHMPLISHEEAKYLGKRIQNIIGKSGSIGKQLLPLRKRGAVSAPQIRSLLRQPAALNFDPPPRTAPAPAPALPLREEPPPPTPPEPPPPELTQPPMPPPTVPLDGVARRTEYEHFHGRYEGDPPKFRWIDCDIPGYRGPASHDDAIYWDQRKPPCVPSDFRPAHLISSKLCAEAVCAARRLEGFMPCEGMDPYEAELDAEQYELTYPKLKWGLHKLHQEFPDVDACPMLAHASQHHTRPCPCGRGVLAKWPLVVHRAELGFCDCPMAEWELICWSGEWIARWPKLGW